MVLNPRPTLRLVHPSPMGWTTPVRRPLSTYPFVLNEAAPMARQPQTNTPLGELTGFTSRKLIRRYTIPELRDWLRQNNLPTNGRKEALCSRIWDAVKKTGPVPDTVTYHSPPVATTTEVEDRPLSPAVDSALETPTASETKATLNEKRSNITISNDPEVVPTTKEAGVPELRVPEPTATACATTIQPPKSAGSTVTPPPTSAAPLPIAEVEVPEPSPPTLPPNTDDAAASVSALDVVQQVERATGELPTVTPKTVAHIIASSAGAPIPPKLRETAPVQPTLETLPTSPTEPSSSPVASTSSQSESTSSSLWDKMSSGVLLVAIVAWLTLGPSNPSKKH
ncbi:hypothetical protein H4R33_001263 [Dimargaris cristalligena]|nr:hypothetical protein H4R33_001263 [Dimargaris cristalligena]